jgi:hypothetical protein
MPMQPLDFNNVIFEDTHDEMQAARQSFKDQYQNDIL